MSTSFRRDLHPEVRLNLFSISFLSFYGTISDQVSVTCRGGNATERYRAIIEYKDESWISKPRFLLEGIVRPSLPSLPPSRRDEADLPRRSPLAQVYKYKAGDAVAENYVKIKDVPPAMVVGTLEGCWRTKVNFKAKGEKVSYDSFMWLLSFSDELTFAVLACSN